MINISPEAKYFFKEDGQLDDKRMGFDEQDLEITKSVLQSLATKRFLQNLPKFKEVFDLIRTFNKQHQKNIQKIIRKRLVEECQLKKKKVKEKTLIIDQIVNLSQEVQLQIEGAQELVQKEITINNNQIIIENLEKLENLEELNYDIKIGKCYCCGVVYETVHFFYDQLCIQCGDFNFQKRNLKCDLTGRIALVTGGRIKIGYQIALQLLRNNCYTIITTRFPKESAFRYSKEEDFQKWKHLLKIYGVDFKCIPLVYRFCDFLKQNYPKLDIIINNAAQTIRRAPIFNSNFEEFEKFNKYFDLDADIQNLLALEFQFQSFELQMPQQISPQINNNIKQLLDINQLQQSEQTCQTLYFINQQEIQYVPGIFDINNQIVDLGRKNSWRMKQEEVPLQELLEVQIINSIAPFIICAQLKQLLERSQFQERFIINVSAAEGQFDKYKSPNHPHTNMSKASLNMMTRTSGQHYALSGIYMNAVDTGWVTDENPKNFNNQFTAPLDEVDGAMRVLDPIFLAINQKKFIHSKFFKHYKEANW